ncbi:diaminopimelate decarboxylase [Leptospira santarosai]|uniref:diaminopimelate decarboxylase n=1 Tax=Leptospira santarosai TaxID=28183 RepID=UPI0024AFE16B|nr:diaminopimelate decarboxylase [Leptospira santarosai]MDI7208428.1 diaminopimelate decarboxylase [Leptospira santarosai]
MLANEISESIRDQILREVSPVANEPLSIGGIPAEKIANTFGSPVYAFDANIFKNKFLTVENAFGSQIKILYALKANPNVRVAKIFKTLGAGCEVASGGEILIASKAGFLGSEIQFAGPGKQLHDLEIAFDKDISSLNVESVSEYKFICNLAKKLNYRPKISLRINPSENLSGARMQMGGGSIKFGIDTDQLDKLTKKILSDNICDFKGLHVYAGTQCFDAEAWLRNARALCDLANILENNIPILSLNFGGGFGVGGYEGDKSFSLDKAGNGIQEIIRSENRIDRKYFIELGRYLTATAGVYLTRVLFQKKSGDKQHFILDGGMHHHGSAAGLGMPIRRSFPIVSCENPRQAPSGKVNLSGPLCTPVDEFGTNLDFPTLEEGDLLGILNSGAYGLSFSNSLFLSHPNPAEVLIENGTMQLIRKPGKPEDALHDQVYSSEETV